MRSLGILTVVDRLFNKRYCKCCKANGTKHSRSAVMAFDPSAQRIRRWRVRRSMFARDYRRAVSARAIDALKANVRRLTQRTRGHSLEQIIAELRPALLGWLAYFGFAEIRTPLAELDKWIRRKLRCYQWKQWGRAGYRRLRALGVSRELAWNTAKSAHGPWRVSRSPALNYAMDSAYFTALGLPTLARSRTQ